MFDDISQCDYRRRNTFNTDKGEAATSLEFTLHFITDVQKPPAPHKIYSATQKSKAANPQDRNAKQSV